MLKKEDSPTLKSPPKRKWVFFLKCVLAILPIIWVFGRVEGQEFKIGFKQIGWWTILVLSFATITSFLLQGLRWWILLRAFSPGLPFLRTMATHFTGIFYSLALPTSAGQDVVRTILISNKMHYSGAWGATWLCRLLGLLVFAVYSLYGLFTIDKATIPNGLPQTVAFVFLGLAFFFVLSFSKKTTRPFRSILNKYLPKRLMTKLENVRDGVYYFKEKRKEVILAGLITGFSHGVMILTGCFVIKGITGTYFFAAFFAFLPLIEIVSLSVALTPNGIGIREVFTAAMFTHLNLSEEQLGVYVILGFYPVLLKLVGGIPVFYGLLKRSRKERGF